MSPRRFISRKERLDTTSNLDIQPSNIVKTRLLYLMLALAGWLPLTHAATNEVQLRFENSLRSAISISRVEIEWLDILWIGDSNTLKAMGVKDGAFVRTFRYAYIASGTKYRVSCQLVSGTATNLVRHRENAFDGTTFYHYTADSRYLTRTHDAARDGAGGNPNDPLLAPLMFLSRQSDDCINCALRFTELASLKVPKALTLAKGQGGARDVEFSVVGPTLAGQPTSWEIELEGAREAFMPKTITRIAPGWRSQIVNRLLNYTNLGGYFFPARIEWAASSFPPTSPPTLNSTGTVTVISARIPSELPAEDLFTLEEEAKLADTVWDGDAHKFNRISPEAAKIKADIASKPKIYDESADGARQLADALAQAKAQHKRVMLQFGANWCAPCHKLHEFLETDKNVSDALNRHYVVVMVDVNKGHNDNLCAMYGPLAGLPTIVILDNDGKKLTTENPEKWAEGGHHDPEKVLAFLQEWISPN